MTEMSRLEAAALAVLVLFFVICTIVLVQSDRADAEHRRRGDVCVHSTTAYVKVGSVFVPVESCERWEHHR